MRLAALAAGLLLVGADTRVRPYESAVAAAPRGGPGVGAAPRGGPSVGAARRGGPSVSAAPRGGPSVGAARRGGPGVGAAPRGDSGVGAGPRAGPVGQIFRSGIAIVELDVSVSRAGVPVSGLTAADFELADNGVAQEVESVMLDRLPLSVTMVLDVSQSVSGDRLAHLTQAGEGLTAALHPGDRAALVTFSHSVDLRVPMTGDMNTIRSGLARLKGDGATALRDAVHLALEIREIRETDRSRPLVLVFTDGHDTASWLTADAVVDTARRVGVVIHVVRAESDGFLNRIVDASGGRTWSATSDRQLRELFTHALDEMRARYLLTYTPHGVQTAGWHELKVKLKNQRADVTARPGYFVAAAPSAPSRPR